LKRRRANKKSEFVGGSKVKLFVGNEMLKFERCPPPIK
jgi:hypothetical protein